MGEGTNSIKKIITSQTDHGILDSKLIRINDTIFTNEKRDHPVNIIGNNSKHTQNKLSLSQKRTMRMTRFGRIKILNTTLINRKRIVQNEKKQKMKYHFLKKVNRKIHKINKESVSMRTKIIIAKEDIEAR